jgi:integrase
MVAELRGRREVSHEGHEVCRREHIRGPLVALDEIGALAGETAPAYTGLRWGELAGLRRCDVDLERNLVSVTRKLAEVNGQLSFSPPKTAAGKRTIGMPSLVARSLAVHIDLYALPGAEGLVFPSADGQPMRRSNFRRRVWEPATTEVGMSGFRFHDLRHTAATLAAASGTSLKALMAGSDTRRRPPRCGTST